jgi:hypothetical protein
LSSAQAADYVLVKPKTHLQGQQLKVALDRIVVSNKGGKRPILFQPENIVYDNIKRWDNTNAVMKDSRVWMVQGTAAKWIRQMADSPKNAVPGVFTNFTSGINFEVVVATEQKQDQII